MAKNNSTTRKIKSAFLTCFAILFASGSFSQTENREFQKVAPLQEARRITETLCSETYFGRGYVKSGDSLAAVFLENEFKKRGLKCFKKSFLQPFKFDVNTFPGKMEFTLGGKALVPAVDFMVDPNSGSSNGDWNCKLLTDNDLFDEKGFEALISTLRGKFTFNTLVIDIRNLKGDSLKKARAVASDFTQVCNMLVVTNEKFTYSVGQEPMNHALVYIQGEAWRRGATLEKDIDIEANIENVFVKNHVANNVVALLPAAKKPKKKPTLVFSAHYDHLGGMGSETYFPGGNDNASGTSMLFTLADYFKENPVPYNIVFIAFAGEEAGLLGSHYYVEHPLFDLKKIKFLLNLDIMGSGEDGITVVNGTLFPKEFESLVTINEQNQFLKQVKKRGTAANSDHYWFTEKGVPAFFIYTMGDNKNYHDVLDTYEALSFSEYEDITKLIAAFVKTL